MTSTPPECGAAVRDRRTAEMSAASVDDGALRERVRSLLQRTGTHPVISLYLDLDPEQFPTPKARDSQITSLLDRSRELAAALPLDHAARKALTADLERVESELRSDDLPVSGAAALAVFCSGSDEIMETIRLDAPAPSAA